MNEHAMAIHWAGLDRIWWAPLFIIVTILIMRWHRSLRKKTSVLVDSINQKVMFKHFSLRQHLIKSILTCSALILIFIALLQPQWGKKEETIIQEGRDVLIILDISRSMKVQDMPPTRLDFAKLKIRNLLSKLTSERVGLIVFSGSAFIQCPLTADHGAFLMFLDHVDTEIISSGTTALDAALTKTLEAFGTAQERKNKLAILLTDGEDFSINLDSVQQKAIRDQMHLFAIGIGSKEGGPIPKFKNNGAPNGHEVDDHGAIVLSVLNESMLQKLCSSLHGHYVHASYDDSDINAITSIISRYQKETFTDKTMSVFHDQYPWFLGIAWICLALDWVL